MAPPAPPPTTSPLPGRAQRPSGWLERIEDAVLAGLLGGMVGLAALQIVLRAFGGGIEWADPLLRAGVLWVGLLGALAASRDDRHIHIDVLSRLLPERGRAVLFAATNAGAAAVALLLAWHGGRFVAAERTFGSVAFSGIPAWVLQAIIPLALGGIALRTLAAAAREARRALAPESTDRRPTSEAGP